MPLRSITVPKPAPAPRVRFLSLGHVMSTNLALQQAIAGTENLIKNVQRMQVPPDLEHGHSETLNGLAEQLQNLRNFQLVLDVIAKQQAQESR